MKFRGELLPPDEERTEVLPEARVRQPLPEILELGPEAAALVRLLLERRELPLQLRQRPRSGRHQASSRKTWPLRHD